MNIIEITIRVVLTILFASVGIACVIAAVQELFAPKEGKHE